MINTECGTKIAPRVGDWCREFDGEENKVFQIKNERHLDIVNDWGWPAADITLMHRGFEVGDWAATKEYGPNAEVIGEMSQQITTDKELAIANQCSCFHKDPALRDHSEYNG